MQKLQEQMGVVRTYFKFLFLIYSLFLILIIVLVAGAVEIHYIGIKRYHTKTNHQVNI
jgi:hypothetical protein